MAGVLGGSNGTTVFGLVDGTDVVMSELNEYKIARFQRVIDTFPASFVQIRTTAAASHGGIDNINLGLVEDGVGYRPPAPHAVRILVGILHCAVTRDEHHRFTLSACQVVGGQLHIAHHGFQRVECWIVTGHQTLGCRAGIHHGAKTTGMNFVEEEVVVGLPLTIRIEFLSGNLVQVNKGHTLLGSYLYEPLCVWLAHNLALVVVGIAWCQRHENGVAALRAYIINIFAHIATIGIYRFLFSSLFDGHVQRIVAHPRDAGTGTS